MKNEKSGSYWTAYYDEKENRYFARIMYISREGLEQHDYEITRDIYARLGTFEDDTENERLIRTAKLAYSFENTMYGTLGPERTVWDEEVHETMRTHEKKAKDGKKKKEGGKAMLINEACELLKKELLDNGYEYGFYLNGAVHKPDMTNGFDKEFFELLMSEYRVQAPEDTMRAKVGTCNDAVVLMKAILDEHGVPSKIWLLNDKRNKKLHTVLTFYLEGKTVYLELTPQSGKPWYGKELVFDSERSFMNEFGGDEREVIDVTDEVLIGLAPDFILRRV